MEQLAVTQGKDELANATLIHTGLLGCSLVQPVIAVSLECLELYHQLQHQQLLFSVQVMVKMLCALQNVSVHTS